MKIRRVQRALRPIEADGAFKPTIGRLPAAANRTVDGQGRSPGALEMQHPAVSQRQAMAGDET